ncbi:MAG: hypothetical protein ACRC5C_07070 [Bacilli bacterium]
MIKIFLLVQAIIWFVYWRARQRQVRRRRRTVRAYDNPYTESAAQFVARELSFLHPEFQVENERSGEWTVRRNGAHCAKVCVEHDDVYVVWPSNKREKTTAANLIQKLEQNTCN